MAATTRAIELATAAARAASDKLARDVVAYDVSDRLAITDAFVLCSAPNDRQVASIVDEVYDRLAEVGAKPVRREGERDNRWVLLDYVDIVVHIQHAEERDYYALERLWRDCPRLELPDDVGPAQEDRAQQDRAQQDRAQQGTGHRTAAHQTTGTQG